MRSPGSTRGGSEHAALWDLPLRTSGHAAGSSHPGIPLCPTSLSSPQLFLSSEIWQMQRAGGLLELTMPCPCSSTSCTLCSPRNGLGALQSPQGWGDSRQGSSWTGLAVGSHQCAVEGASRGSSSNLGRQPVLPNWFELVPFVPRLHLRVCHILFFPDVQAPPGNHTELTQRSRSQQRKKQQELLKPP